MKFTNERIKNHSTDCESVVNNSFLDIGYSKIILKEEKTLSSLQRKEQSIKSSLFFLEEKNSGSDFILKKKKFSVFKNPEIMKPENFIFEKKSHFEKNMKIKNLLCHFEKWYKNSLHKITPEIFLKKTKKNKKEKEEVSILTKIIEKSLTVEKISKSDLDLLNDLEKNILKLFIQKKFHSKNLEIINNEIIIPKIKKSKRNEEILKFSLKGFFKKICMEKKKDINCKKNFFELKKELCLFIFREISSSLNLKLEDFLKLSFIDEKKLIIKGNKKILLYNNSEFFKKNITSYLKNNLIFDYKKKRKDKISTIIFNIYIKFVKEKNYNLKDIEKFFLNNPKLKLPWSNQELERAKNYCCKNFSC